ncbi:MAG: LysM peptidoglycan-binding domain-containing protein [Lachnospiraceae bacterium]|nr:LysM peptidoglycan-binding domain-containing protein [Lachnospiraceae bacterium]
MGTYKRVSEMNDREYRIYKRNLRRRRDLKKKLVLFAVTFCLVIVCTVSYQAIKSGAASGENMNFKYYTMITVQSGDTLWSIADSYIDYSQYKNKQQYISEVVNINKLEDASDIISGQKITVPYYSSEFIKAE